MFIDIACNITSEEFKNNIDDLIEQCKKHKTMPIFVGLDYKSSLKCLEYAEKYNTCCYLGIHPCYTNEKKIENVAKELELLDYTHPRVIGVGETGLDYFRLDNYEQQKQVFNMHINLDNEISYFYHCRSGVDKNAYDDFLELIKNKQGVVHSFDGTCHDAARILAKGLYIGINGCSLKNEQNIEVLKQIPINRILIETDSPYCLIRKSYAASKYLQSSIKCKYNSPTNIKQIVEVIAEIKKCSMEELTTVLYNNTITLFPKIKPYIEEWMQETII